MKAAAETETQLRNYAWLMTGALSVFGGLALLRGSSRTAVAFFFVAAAFCIFGLAYPAALGPVYRAWMGLAHVLAWINTRIILSVFYYLVVTPMSLTMKLVRRDALKRKLDRSRASYWQPRPPMKPAKDSYEHLY